MNFHYKNLYFFANVVHIVTHVERFIIINSINLYSFMLGQISQALTAYFVKVFL